MLGTIAVAALVIGAVFALTQRAEQRAQQAAASSPLETAPEPQTHPVEMSAGTVASPRADTATVAQLRVDTPSAVAQPTVAEPAPQPTLTPVVAEGRTDLGDSVFADREGGDVTVRFDNGLLRTRQDQKFERVVRATLPKVFGPAVATALDSIPEGRLFRGRTLLTELPSRGIALALPAIGKTMMVYPVTRPGREGPLVVAYRATIAQ
ncbi:MAG TPA: hypothetical protein VFT29_11615 [Gemmatimonadaceae bacterium]|nr:hypothetical protein [Gemmatimonadaceae bacterium]